MENSEWIDAQKELPDPATTSSTTQTISKIKDMTATKFLETCDPDVDFFQKGFYLTTEQAIRLMEEYAEQERRDAFNAGANGRYLFNKKGDIKEYKSTYPTVEDYLTSKQQTSNGSKS